jgi:hypothetical protein
MGGCFIINNNISQAECDRVCAFVRGVLSHGNSVMPCYGMPRSANVTESNGAIEWTKDTHSEKA